MNASETQKVILLADSGGSKTDWVLLDGATVLSQLQTPGLNPSLVGPEMIRMVLKEQVQPWMMGKSPRECWFFGAGLTRKTPKNRMRKLLRTQLQLSGKIAVEPDILGAGYACLGKAKGLVGILGTGSVAFRFNGKKITDKKGGLGYLIGDVGGGVALGRTFLRRLVNKDLPKVILDSYPHYSGISINSVLETLYSHVAPARFLAAQVPFLALHRKDPVLSKIIMEQFEGFLEVYLGSLIEEVDEQVVFMGGVARTFGSELIQICKEKGIPNAKIHRDPPIKALTVFFGNREI